MQSSDENRYGFANGDESTAIFAAKAEPSAVFTFLSEHINTHSYIPEALEQSINLPFSGSATYIYQSHSSDWTIVAPYYDNYFRSPNQWKLLSVASAQLKSAAICFIDATDDILAYSYYVDSHLIESAQLDSIKYRGYEDAQSLTEVERNFANQELEADYYFHHINDKENINRFVVGRSKGVDLTIDFMKREGLYVPYFDLKRQPAIDSVMLDFEDIKVGDFKSFGLFFLGK